MNTTKYAPGVQWGLYGVKRASCSGVGWPERSMWAGTRRPSGRLNDLVLGLEALGAADCDSTSLFHQLISVTSGKDLRFRRGNGEDLSIIKPEPIAFYQIGECQGMITLP